MLKGADLANTLASSYVYNNIYKPCNNGAAAVIIAAETIHAALTQENL
jgi:hypothetical protein